MSRDNIWITKPIDVQYLDFQKPFDKVPHLRLVYKLHINGKLLAWIHTYLVKSSRTKAVLMIR